MPTTPAESGNPEKKKFKPIPKSRIEQILASEEFQQIPARDRMKEVARIMQGEREEPVLGPKRHEEIQHVPDGVNENRNKIIATLVGPTDEEPSDPKFDAFLRELAKPVETSTFTREELMGNAGNEAREAGPEDFALLRKIANTDPRYIFLTMEEQLRYQAIRMAYIGNLDVLGPSGPITAKPYDGIPPRIKENESLEDYLSRLDRFQIINLDQDELIAETGLGVRQVQPLLMRAIDEKWKMPDHLKEVEQLDGEGSETLADNIHTVELSTGDQVAFATFPGVGYKSGSPCEDISFADSYADTSGVIDGMGGGGGVEQKGSGKVAADLLTSSFHRNFANPQKAVNNTIEDLKIKGVIGGACYASVRMNKKEDGTKEALVTRMGDVKVLIIRGEELLAQTNDESEVQFFLDKGVISDDEALYHQRRNVVMNPVSDSSEPSPKNQTVSIPVEPGDSILILSDGISDNFTPDEIVAMTHGKSPEETIEILSNALARRMKYYHDVYKLDPEGELDKRKKDGVFGLEDGDGFRSAPKPDNCAISAIKVS